MATGYYEHSSGSSEESGSGENSDFQNVVDFSLGTVEEIPNRGLLAILRSEKHTDLSFIVEGKVVRAHRIVVASQSSYFDRLLYGCMRESSSNQIKLHDTPWEAFNLILGYMYSGYISARITCQVVLDLLVLADRYEFMILKAKLEELLSSNINISTVLQLMSYADMYSAENLHKRCAEFVDSHAKQILVSPSMLLVPRAHLKTLLMRDSFFAKEIDIFEAVMRWKDYNEMDASDIQDILECVRLSEISPELLEGIVKPSGVYSMEDIQKALKEAAGTTESVETSIVKMPRGKFGFDLFKDPSTSLEACTNFNVSIDPNLFGRISYPLPSQQEFTLMFPSPHAYASIVFQFSDIYVINHVTFVAWCISWDDDRGWEVWGAQEAKYQSDIEHPYMYILEVSKDGSDWTAVIDHSICKCYFNQYLYFPRHAAKYLRLRVTKAHEYLKVKFKACCFTDCDLPYKFFSGGSIAPTREMAPEFITNWDTSSGQVRCMLTLHQPYHISRVKLLFAGLEPCATHFGQVLVSVSLYNKARSYDRVGDVQHNFSENLVVNFSARLISIVSIHFANYYDGVTGEDLFKSLQEAQIEVRNFKIVCI